MPINNEAELVINYEKFWRGFEDFHKPMVQLPVNPVRELFIMDDLVFDDEYGAEHHGRTQEYIKKLQESYPFLLAGSRHFAQRAIAGGYGEDFINIEDDTDYDLFIEHNENVCSWLGSEGFAKLQMEKYGGRYTKALFTHPDHPLLQITTRLRADAYKKVIDEMPVVNYREYGWKRGPNKLTKEQIQEHFEAYTDWAVKEIDKVQ